MRPVTDITRRVAPFHVVSEFQPSGDQPQAIAELEKRVNSGEQDVVLLGATGTCLLYTSPSPRDGLLSRMPSSA